MSRKIQDFPASPARVGEDFDDAGASIVPVADDADDDSVAPTMTLPASPVKSRVVTSGISESSFTEENSTEWGASSTSPRPINVATQASAAPTQQPSSSEGRAARASPAASEHSASRHHDQFTGIAVAAPRANWLRVTLGVDTPVSCISGHMEYEVLCSLNERRWKLMRRYSVILQFKQALKQMGVSTSSTFPKKEYVIPVDLDKRKDELNVSNCRAISSLIRVFYSSISPSIQYRLASLFQTEMHAGGCVQTHREGTVGETRGALSPSPSQNIT
eukprot:m.48025 g.48025  ORF g.48025 m.48025 type:complete len:275 (-) comp15769_c0_seq2:179-1003(-)